MIEDADTDQARARERLREGLVGVARPPDAEGWLWARMTAAALWRSNQLDDFPVMDVWVRVPRKALVGHDAVLGVQQQDWRTPRGELTQPQAQPVAYGARRVEDVALRHLLAEVWQFEHGLQPERTLAGPCREAPRSQWAGVAQGGVSPKWEIRSRREVGACRACPPFRNSARSSASERAMAPRASRRSWAFVGGPVGDRFSWRVQSGHLKFSNNTIGNDWSLRAETGAGVTGGVWRPAKAAELVRLLGKAGADVHVVVLTEAPARDRGDLPGLVGNPVWTDLWDPRMPNNMAHTTRPGMPTRS